LFAIYGFFKEDGMKLNVLVVMVAFGLVFGSTACDKITGGDEKKAEAAKEEPKAEEPKKDEAEKQEDVKKDEDATEKKVAEGEKKDDGTKEEVDAAKKEVEVAKNAAKEAEDKTKAAQAEADKIKSEAADKQKKAEEEAAKAKAAAEEQVKKAQEEAAKAQEGAVKMKKEAIVAELKTVTEELTKLKADLTSNLAVWKGTADEAKTAEREAFAKSLDELEAERMAVEGLLAQDKVDDARTKLDLVKTKLAPLKEKVLPLLADKPIDPNRWEIMLQILADETCLTKKNLPAQDFQKERDALFTTYGMDRIEYETLRAEFTKTPSQRIRPSWVNL